MRTREQWLEIIRRDYTHLTEEAHQLLADHILASHPDHNAASSQEPVAIVAEPQPSQPSDSPWPRRIFYAILALILATLLAPHLHAQNGTSQIDVISFRDNANALVGSVAAPFIIKAGSNCSLAKVGSIVTFNCTGGAAAAGGSNTQVQYNSATALGGISTFTSDGTNNTAKVGTNWSFVDPTDATKKLQFDASNIATGTTRTVNIPNANSTTVQPDAGAANNYISAISGQGVITKSRPACATLSDAGTLCTSSSTIPTDVSAKKYLIQTADAALPNAQAMGALGTGIVKNTTTTGVQSIAVAGDFPTLNQNTSGTAASFTGSLAGDVTGTQGATVVGKINGVSMAGLATGILKNTTTTGVPSIAVAGDFPTLNQNTSGTAANLSGTPALPNGTTATTQAAADNSTKLATTAYADAVLKAQYKIWTCESGLGDGLNAVTAGTYLQSFCFNTTGVTVTLTAVKCYTDNAGSSTLNAAGNTLGALLAGAVTCSSTIASGTQSANVALTNGDYVKFTWVADGTSKQSTWVVTGTY